MMQLTKAKKAELIEKLKTAESLAGDVFGELLDMIPDDKSSSECGFGTFSETLNDQGFGFSGMIDELKKLPTVD